MQRKRMLRALILALILSPLIGMAQSSSPPTDVCQSGCRYQYEQAVARCANQSGADRDACEQAATLAMKTCLVWCPGNR